MIEQKDHPVGLLLTAGVEKTYPKNYLTPDAEGRIRTEAALIDLRRGVINDIYICGGSEVEGLELGDYYYFYLKDLLKNEGLEPNKAKILEGGYETGGDIDRALDRIDEDIELRVYSTSYHLGRVRLILKSLSREAILVKAEKLVAANSAAGEIEVQSALTEKFLKNIYKREEKITSLLGLLDHNPLLPQKLRLGSRILEEVAYRRSE